MLSYACYINYITVMQNIQCVVEFEVKGKNKKKGNIIDYRKIKGC